MPVAFDAFTASAAATTTRSFTHTPVGTPRAVVLIGVSVGAIDEFSTGTYGGVAATEVANSPVIKATGEAMTIHAYFLGSGIPTGAQTAVLTASATTLTKIAYCLTFTADDDTETVDVDATISSDSVADPSVTLSLGGRTCLAMISFVSGQDNLVSITPITGWTNRGETDGGPITIGNYTYDTVSTVDVTAGWIQTAEDAIAIALAISEVAGGGGDIEAFLVGGKLVGKGILLTGLIH